MEIMVSVAILSIGLVLIIQSQVFCAKALQTSDERLRTTLAAGSQMAQAELLAKQDWEQLQAGLSEELELGGLDCSWQVNVEDMEWPIEAETEAFEDIRKVEATLSWQRHKRPGEIPLTTLIRDQR